MKKLPKKVDSSLYLVVSIVKNTIAIALNFFTLKHSIFVLTLFLLTTIYSLLPTKSVMAAENFTTAYDVTYAVDEAGITHVTMKVKLTNTSSQYYASQYKIHVGFDNMTNIKASDPEGAITPKVMKTDEGNAVGVVFNKKVVGKGNTLSFSLTFDTTEIAKKRGEVLSVNIPGIAEQEDFSDFVVHVEVPSSFGSPTYSKPKQEAADLTFTKEELGAGGISLAFGQKQAYDFYLTYHLQNKNLFPIRTEIALPPSTNYQTVYFTSIEPRPTNVIMDKDGNWLAQYQLEGSEKIDVIARGKAYIALIPKKETESDIELRDYVKEQEYWEVSDKEIQKLARELKTPRAIYDYVVKTLDYDFDRVTGNDPRLGAAAVLKDSTSAVCLEFTDLFITLARAAGIPAREVNGYAYTENDRQRPLSLVKDILHAWPEYYDREKETWVMVDPTWGNTTGGIDYFSVLDFDHFTFIRKGYSSTYPIPPGGYKLSDADEGKDVHIEFGSQAPLPEEMIEVTPQFSEKNLSFFPLAGALRIKNTGVGYLSPRTITVTSDTLTPRTQKVSIPGIPPYGTVTVPLTFEKVSLLTNATHAFTIHIAAASIRHEVKIVPFVLSGEFILGGIIIGIFSLIVFIIALKTRRIPILRRK